MKEVGGIVLGLRLEPAVVQVGQPAHSRVECPFSSAERKIISKGLDFTEVTLPIVERNISRVLPKPDDVGTSISRQVDYEPWVLRNLPPLIDAEVVEGQLGWLESAPTVVKRDVNPRVPESYDVAAFVAREVGNETRVLVDLPSLCGSEVVDDQVNGSKSTIAVV